MWRTLALPIFILLFNGALAQHQELDEDPNIWGEKTEAVDTDKSLLIDFFREGTIDGHFRNFFSYTKNGHGLTDWYANAAGGGIRFETAKFYGFQLAVSGFYIFNISSSDLSAPDPTTGVRNRYEIGLFNVEDFTNTKNLDRLEEFHIKYNYRKSEIILGKQLINTPFINLQDGRMRPTAVQGLYFNFNELPKTRMQGAVLTSIAPRSTIRYMGVGESIGIYPVGVNPDGSRSGYSGKVQSNFVAMLGVNHRPSDWLTVQFWNVFVDNIFNTMMFQADIEKPAKGNGEWLLGGQVIRQNKMGNGGNKEESLRFMTHQAAFTFGGRMGYRIKQWEHTLNYNRITKEGRYLMPREWGRDPFYTFIPRERNEGFSDLHAITARSTYSIPNKGWRLSLSTGYFHMPDVLNFENNKYGMPTYWHTNLDIRYSFSGFWKGLEAQLLVVNKTGMGETYDDLRFVINKVDMFLYNLVINYRF